MPFQALTVSLTIKLPSFARTGTDPARGSPPPQPSRPRCRFERANAYNDCMFFRSLKAIDEAAIRALERDEVPECLELEYKRELDLSKKDQRREAAKDISAMANTVGGCLVYGVDERVLPDKSVVAGPIVPLTDGTVVDTLANVLNSTIHPRPSFRLSKVDVAGGFVLVADVHRSYADLHMVCGYADNRFYKRGPTGVVPMTEPEVRDAYGRIHATRAKIDAHEKEMIEPELGRRHKADESILVTPLYGHPALLDPRRVTLRDDLQTVFQGERQDLGQELSFAVKIQADGYRVVLGGDEEVYLAALKNGLIHWSFDRALMKDSKAQHYDYQSLSALQRILEALVLARLLYERVGYRGPVRARYRLSAPGSFALDRNRLGPTFFPTIVPAGIYPAGPVDAHLQGGLTQIAKELLDPIFNAAGKAASPWFDADGNLVEERLKGLPPGLAHHLD